MNYEEKLVTLTRRSKEKLTKLFVRYLEGAEKKSFTFAPQGAFLLQQNPMKTGSAILTRILSTQYTWRNRTSCLRMSVRAPDVNNAR